MKINFKTRTTHLVLFILFLFCGCSKDQQKSQQANDSITEKKRVDSALTEERRNNLTIDEIIQQFKDGNKRFINDESIQNDYIKQVMQTGNEGQFPKAIVLGCIDSRAPTEEVFDKGIGEIFGCRVAGNYADEGVLGGIEFACKVAGAKVIIVMGHTDCGAIKGACDNVKLGNLTYVMDELNPAVDSVKGFDNARTSTNKDFVTEVTKKNVLLTVKKILADSEIISDLVKEGKVKIVGTVYDVKNGKVDFLN